MSRSMKTPTPTHEVRYRPEVAPIGGRLSPAQVALLARMAADGGTSQVPGGYREAGRDASAWWRTARALADRGLVDLSTVGAGSGWARLTDAGVEAARVAS